MDVGTASSTPAEQQGVPHHLLDVLDVVDEASVAAYQRAADSVVDDLLARGRTPVLVGGSGLYVRAALDEPTIPPTEPAVRARLEAEAADLGASALHERLQAVDPVAASQILPTNTRRVVRALEVVERRVRRSSRRCPTRCTGVRPCRWACGPRCRCSTRGSSGGSSGCGRAGCSTRCAGSTGWGCARG
ncbi:hypothetical protein GCM10025868_07050 [Angustibacter aerolatus]|uniref:tRNA dimethylallyltransferase n=1 Tax=Angustibacter aerolatus TaxID=1162965 RepID=A0ABQ6JBA0_9ACTN|nr:tRNA dimethylallyltransferase [Angustibacter aerolatus]GMA85455.1 hypothetical protein GCM10025868_07050 [Angustibacter aerolatus]